MTSRQPGPMPRWPPLVLPVALLILAGLTGLRGGVTAPRWDGPLHGDAIAVGVALEIVLGTMLGFAIRRVVTRSRGRTARVGPASPVADTLRQVPAYVLGAGMIAVVVTLIVGVHQHLFSGPAGALLLGHAAGAAPATAQARHFRLHLFALHLHVAVELLYGLLVLVFLGAVVLRVGWTRWFRPSGPARVYRYLVPDSQDLLEVVESGRSALRAIDDARAAIIACYVAMEASLAEHGAARAIADTPDELLTRATAMGIVRGTAAARLTTLFYEARFSSHPLDRGHRDAAGQALGELAAELAHAEAAGTGGRR
jgi:hypothetical protein